MGRTEKTRRKYILNLLNNNTYDYIASVDYGKHELEHYHALVVLKKEEDISYNRQHNIVTDWLIEYSKKYGNYYIEKVNDSFIDFKRVTCYLAKKKITSILYKNTNLIYKRRIKCLPY